MNQKELAEWLDVTPRHVRNWIDEGVFPRPRGRAGYDLRRCVLALLEYKSKKAQTPQKLPSEIGASEVELEIAREKLVKLQIENAKLTRDLAPRSVLEHYAMQVGATVHEGLQALAGGIKKKIPHLRAAEVTAIKQEIAKISNAIVNFDPDHKSSA